MLIRKILLALVLTLPLEAKAQRLVFCSGADIDMTRLTAIATPLAARWPIAPLLN